MRKLITSLAAVALFAFVGCKDMNHDDHNMNHDNMNKDSSMKTTEPKKMSMDACSHCSGVQTATADGKCPLCGGKADMKAEMK